MRKNKIRILHVAQAAGGVDRYIRMLLRYLDKEKFENILVCSQDFHEEDYRDLVDLFEQVEMTRAIGGNDVKAIKEVRTLIKKYNPDIVYAHSSKAGAIARVADIGLKNHCVYNPHGWAFNMRCSAKKKAMYTAIEKVAALFCDKIICISDAEKQSALDKKICKEDKLQVIFNGVDIEAYENGVHGAVKRRELNIPEDAFVVGMVGRMSPQKAPDVFIKMAKLVKEKVPNAHFIIVGNGNQEAEIRKYAENNGFSDSLHITGWVDNPMSYVELFDVACLLSRWEGFGLALPEYMMAGKPIVASRVDAISNIIRDGENGLLIEVDDDVRASEAVLRIYWDKSLKDKLVLQGMEDVHNRFNARRVSDEHGILFENMRILEII
ncbi:MAG: glycosyltransferase family 4 protein [Anaerostipes hadrus]|nr:glycosyltransferase family 4 protein [Anaerostipes hadrus]